MVTTAWHGLPSEPNFFLDDAGYVNIYLPHHPQAAKGYVLQHRYVMEQHIGRLLEPHEVVHHIDYDKTHNVPDNLYLTTGTEHVRIHNRERIYSQGTKLKIRKAARKLKKR